MFKKIIIVALILCGGFATSFYFYKPIETEEITTEEKPYFTYSNITLGYYEDAFFEDFIDTTYSLENGVFDTTVLGEHSVIVSYIDGDTKYEEEVSYNVKDLDEPIIIMGNSYTIELGSEFNYKEKFIIADNYDSQVNCDLDGEYSVFELGTYNLTITCIDSSENEHTEEFTLKVVEEVESSSYNPTILYFSNIVEEYKTENTKIGIDVSKWQGSIDFETVKDAGAEFVIIRAGYSTSSGYFYEDTYFETNLKNAKEAGLDVGIYFYSQSTSVDAAISEAEFVVDLLDGVELELPISYDWEIWSEFNDLSMSLIEFNNMKNSFINTVESYGYEGMNYGSLYYLRYIYDKNSPTWVAHYEITETTYEYDYNFWQMTSSGVIDGISGYVDINILYY